MMIEEDNDNEAIELVDLGDACVETKQYSPYPMWVDSVFGYGEWNF